MTQDHPDLTDNQPSAAVTVLLCRAIGTAIICAVAWDPAQDGSGQRIRPVWNQAGGPTMVDEIPDRQGLPEAADTLAPPAADAGPETTDAGPVSPPRDSAAPSTGTIPTPTAAVTPTSPAVDASGLGTFGTPVPGPVVPGPDYSAAGVPSLDYVRDKIESRYAHSLGATELAEGIPEVKSFEDQAAKREEAARDKLEEIRRSLRGGSSS
jgi:hypothetical protein